MRPTIPEKTCAHLEWDRVRLRLGSHCRGPVAVERALSLDFAPDAAALEARLDRVSEARELIDAGYSAPLSGSPDVGQAVALAARGAVLDSETLSHIGHLVEGSGRCRAYFFDIATQAPRLAETAEGLAALPDLGRALLDAFDERGAVANSASGELGLLRTRVTTLHEQLKTKVHGLLSDPVYEDMLQEEYYTIREDRYVLPIRSGHKNHVAGIVHGWSGSGATVYIEPQAVVESNNRLVLAQAEIEVEIRRILTALSKRVGQHAAEIAASQDALAALDLAWAGGCLSKELDATRPTLGDDSRCHLVDARHPLLVLAQVDVVGNTIEFGDPQRVLVLTGPNTGGKTVALKTAGLCTLMAMAGLHIPAGPGARVPRVPGVFCDIGDEQSLEHHQSTFGGHIAALMTILDAARPGALVLLDELVVGTDPIQGAALAQALLEAFANRECLVVVTTHYESLKVLPFDDHRFRNGAMGFDADTGRPTYRLAFDVPGTSSALLTARRLGLDDAIVERASVLAGPQQHALQTVLQDLEQQRAAAERARLQAERETRATEALRRQVEAQERRLADRLKAGLAKERGQAMIEARQLRDEVRQLQRALRDEGKRRDVRSLSKIKGRAETAIEELAARQREAAHAAAGPAVSPEQYTVGQRVWVVSLANEAELVEGPDHRGRCTVRAGILTAQVNITDLRPRSEGKGAKSKAPRRPAPRPEEPVEWGDAPPITPDITVDVRGHRVDEALERVEAFLDACYERDRPIAFIIHGHGTGALKREVRRWLQQCQYAREQRPGERHEGGDGVTAVLLS
jgi:DNA mismatch repair protein MutS2